MATLHNKNANLSKKISDIDNDIYNYILQNQSSDFDDLLIEEERWEVFFQLSSLRKSLLSWYDFDKGAEVLEIGAGFGSLTGLLCEKCAHVTATERSVFRAEAIYKRYSRKNNLDIYAGDVYDISFPKKFDCIILVGLLERIGEGSKEADGYINYLRHLYTLLKPEGKLLIAVDNRFGLKYFCGAQEQHTKRPFSGINGYRRKGRGYTFSKSEIFDIVTKAGFEFVKFYYPMPDYKLPQLIYTDEILPQKNLKERLIPYYTNRDTLVAYEQDIYDDLIDNQVFCFFSNSFFLECSLINSFCNVTYASISSDRGNERSFVTKIYNTDVVKKEPLYVEGKKNVKKLYNNISDLKLQGLKVVSPQIKDDMLIMPYIKNVTLSNYLKEIIKNDSNEFLMIFDKLYQLILQSSSYVNPEMNLLMDNSTRNLDWGSILEKAYIELIPLNSFYINNEIVFFDQEFIKENYPAKYILFRAIHYTYIFDSNVEKIVPINNLKDKYKLTELWDIFIEEENKFLAKVRNHKRYQQFYNWTRVERKVIEKNIDLLGSDDEVLADYKVDGKMKAIWKIQLKILEQFKVVCEKNSLNYFMVYGTLLGAVRHKGFIPWDDDVDIMMPRKDYEKLKNIANHEFQYPYFLQTPENDMDCFSGGFLRLRNSDTTAILLRDFGRKNNQGIWIDILPLDIAPNDRNDLKKQREKIKHIQSLLYAKIYGNEYKFFGGLGKFKWKMYCLLSKFFSHGQLCAELEKEMRKYENEQESDYVAIFTHYNRYQAFDRRDIKSAILLDFVHLRLSAPIGYKRCLEMSMGKDYMEYPPVEERKPHHKGIYNTEISYKAYNKMFINIFDDIKDKTIVLFGAGFMFEDYMKVYGNKYKPNFLIDNDSKKWGNEKNGIMIKSPQEILDIPKDKLHLIICSFYYRQIEIQLKQMGITEYKVYVQRKDWIFSDEEKGRENGEKI